MSGERNIEAIRYPCLLQPRREQPVRRRRDACATRSDYIHQNRPSAKTPSNADMTVLQASSANQSTSQNLLRGVRVSWMQYPGRVCHVMPCEAYCSNSAHGPNQQSLSILVVAGIDWNPPISAVETWPSDRDWGGTRIQPGNDWARGRTNRSVFG